MWGFCKFEKKIEKEQYEIKCIKDYIDHLKLNPDLDNVKTLIADAQAYLLIVLKSRTSL
jgi:hypothetical protein